MKLVCVGIVAQRQVTLPMLVDGRAIRLRKGERMTLRMPDSEDYWRALWHLRCDNKIRFVCPIVPVQ